MFRFISKPYSRLSLITKLWVIVSLITITIAIVAVYISSQNVASKVSSTLRVEHRPLMDLLVSLVKANSVKNNQSINQFDFDDISETIKAFGKATDLSKITFRYVSDAASYNQSFDIKLEAPRIFANWCGTTEELSYREPIIIQGEYYGVLIISMSPIRIINEAWFNFTILLNVLFTSFLFVIVGVWLVLKKSLLPLSNLIRASDAIAAGDFSIPLLPTSGSTELLRVTSAFNHMARNVDSTLSALNESESHFRQLAESIPQLIWTCDVDGYFIYTNLNWQTYTGTSTNQQLQHPWLQYLSPRNKGETERLWLKAQSCKQQFRVERTLINSNGECHWFDIQISPVFDEKGQIKKWFASNTDISDHKEAELRVRNSEKQLNLVLEGSHLAFWDWDIASDKMQCNKILSDILGYQPGDIRLSMQQWTKLIHPEDRDKVCQSIEINVEGSSHFHKMNYRVKTQAGEYKWLSDRGNVVERDLDGQAIRMAGTYSDYTARKLAENQLTIAATAFESIEGMMITDANNLILRVNKSFTSITGYSFEDVVGKSPSILSSKSHSRSFFHNMWQQLKTQDSWKGEITNLRKNGEQYPSRMSINTVRDPKGKITNFVGAFVDISEQKAAELEIQKLAFYDPLTELPNRRLLIERLKQVITASERNQYQCALLFIDLDQFKVINDTLGHDIGDLLLKEVARRFHLCLRSVDTVARVGGDEFVVLIDGLSEDATSAATQVDDIGTKLLQSINNGYLLKMHSYYTSASIGAVLFSGNKYGVTELLKFADIAMYDAKKKGRNIMRFFDPEMQNVINERVNLETDLRTSVERKLIDFQLYYQKQVDADGITNGAEALIRWNHNKRGLVSPLDFIDLAEESDLIIPIGEWVMDTACAQLKKWQSQSNTQDLTLSVNVSAKQFHHEKFVQQVEDTVKRHNINTNSLNLELTESMLLTDVDSTILKMKSLQSLGIKFELDDFGTGYSSLQYLKKLPLNRLKIDQSFVHDIVHQDNARSIVKTIITMAHSLGLTVIAEGVEEEQQRKALLDNGCLRFQGYLFGKPVPIENFEKML